LYGRGSQGDYFALQMRDNKMLLNIDLGTFTNCVLYFLVKYKNLISGAGVVTSLSVGSLLDDNMWHDVIISRNKRDLMFSVDRVVVQGKIKGDFSRLNLNRDVSLENYNVLINGYKFVFLYSCISVAFLTNKRVW